MSDLQPQGGIASEPATSRLSRLLTMVPWLMNRQGIDIDDAARTLGVSTAQIEKDLSLLFVCGTPGHMPDDLIEAEWEEGHVYIRNADEISRPLRFTRDEALALTVGLRTLLDVPGLTEQDATQRALAKLVEATGETTPHADRVRVELGDDGDVTLRITRDAIQRRRRLHLRYLVASRDEMTDRDVDPIRVLSADGHWYLEGWCHRAEAVRLFRLDRIEDITVLDVEADVPSDARTTDLSAGFFAGTSDDPSARIRLHPGAHWVADYYPCHDIERHEDVIDATFFSGDGRWLRRLVLRLGGDAEVLTPSPLREDIVAEARRALAAYEAPQGATDA